MERSEKETHKTEKPFVLKCSEAKKEIADAVKRAIASGIPYTVICEILLNISNQANTLATQEQVFAKVDYDEQMKKEG